MGFRNDRNALLVFSVAGFFLGLPLHGQVALTEEPTLEYPEPTIVWLPEALKEVRSKWSFEFGVGVLADTTPGDYLTLQFKRFEGRGEGLTYNFTAACRIYEPTWRLGRLAIHPELEIPTMLTLVDQNVGGIVPDLNTGLQVRWKDFPWHRFVYTTFAIGGGFSYSFDIWEADHSRHPGTDRSRLKFWLPVQLTFAAPQYPRHQLTAFIDHASGGQIFERGGIDVWGFGYRFQF